MTATIETEKLSIPITSQDITVDLETHSFKLSLTRQAAVELYWELKEELLYK